ncbi:hypothetical protein [Streptomyces reniochalinae]|uniref:hypothetical protein n=1 Tax=Streptomyces reniochalinae TaxID=2250578 RepID=UPI001FE97CD9|nr:hypothetical protein [Streptomyces reniochalinae]
MNDTPPPPAIEPFLASLCDGEITDKDYVGYFMNEHGEEMVFAQRRGEKTARLWHGDADGELYRVGDRSIRADGELKGMSPPQGWSSTVKKQLGSPPAWPPHATYVRDAPDMGPRVPS